MFWRRKRSQSDFSAEVQSHITLEIDRLRAAGLSEEEARSEAHKLFGNVLHSEERFYESQRAPWLNHLEKDVIYATRQLTKNKTFTVVATLTLALGVGSTTAIFTLVHATLLRALRFREGDRIVHISDVRTVGQSTGGLVGVPRFFDLQARSKSFDSLAFFYFDHPTLIAGSSLPTPLNGASVSGRYWNTIGITPMLGRAFNEGDDRANSPPVAILSYSVWQRLFGGDPNVVNRQVTLNGKGATIVGVLPQGLEYPRKIEIWTPSHFDPAEWTWRGEGTRFVGVLGRLSQNVPLSSMQEELRSIGEHLQREHPDTDANWQFGSESMRDYLYGGVKVALLLLMAASGVLLLIACINVANLLLSRGTTRAQEIALRRALGASQSRILAQFFTENTLLALLGSGIGLLAAYVAIRWFGTDLPGRLGSSGIEISWPIVWFTFAIAALTGIVFGCVPALQTRRLDLNTNLKRGDARVGGAAGSGMRTAFISTEVALSLVLLVGASLLAESLWHLIKSPLGFQPDHVLTFEIKLPRNEKAHVVKRFFDGLQSRTSLLPGVIAVGQISALPTVDWHLRSNFDVDWKPRTPHGDAVNVEDRAVAGDYLRAMGIPLLAGRRFTEADAQAKQPRALVNQQFARKYFPDGNVIGRHLINKFTQFEIIGVMGDVRGTAGSIAAPAGPELYFLPDENDGSRSFVVRSSVPSEQLVEAIRQRVHQLDPTQAIRNVATLTQRLNESVAQARFNAGLLTSFAVIAVILACVGIYGVVSYSVTRRSLEIGIRMALGATGMQILSLFVTRTLSAALAGLGIGTIAALFLTRLLRSQLYGVEPNHLLTFGVAALALLIPTLLASVLPAVKAANLNPVSQFRKD
jgi:predicted permease